MRIERSKKTAVIISDFYQEQRELLCEPVKTIALDAWDFI